MAKIDKRIISYKVLTQDKEEVMKEPEEVLPTDKVIAIEQKAIPNMGEHIKREEILDGRTYKIKPSTSEHAYYITINNINVDGKLHPFEIFINSKGIEHFKFMAITRLISAVFRKAGDISFLAEELKAVHDPLGAYTSKRCYESGKRKRFNSIEAEIGDIIEEHLLYLAKDNELDEIIASAIEETLPNTTSYLGEAFEYIPNIGHISKATICAKCGALAVIRLDGCDTCTECGESKCN